MDEKFFIKNEFENYGLSLSDEMVERLLIYYHLLVNWNEKMNLTSVTDFEDVVRKHFLDSAALFLRPCDMKDGFSELCFHSENVRLIDVGTGAGFPGLVLAILRPDWEFVLVDSRNKRLDFISEVVRSCSLSRVSVVHGRAEELGRDVDYRGQFDLCVARAVAELPSLLELCVPFLSEDGIFVSYRGSGFLQNQEEKCSENALRELNARLAFVQSFEFSFGARCLVGVERMGDLSDKYPRRPGIPTKRPL